MPPVVLVDGKPVALIGALDRGLSYGDGVFRTMRATGGRVLWWPRHVAKLLRDCERLAIPSPSDKVLLSEVRQVLSAESDCVVKIIITRGSGGRGYAPPGDIEPVRVVARFSLPAIPADRGSAGICARWCRTQVSMQPALAGVKHLNRLDSVLARAEWSEPEVAEGMMLDRDGWVVQGTMTNVFILEGDRLITPILNSSGVAGVQRERLMGLAAQVGLKCVEDRIAPDRLLAADQVYVTNSVIGLWWLSRLDNRRWDRRDISGALLECIEQAKDE